MRRPHDLTAEDFPFPLRPPISNPSELDELVALCRAGKLYEVEDWIRTDKPLQWQQSKDRKVRARHTPLQIALEKRFYSLAALLLANGYNPNLDDRWFLYHAVRRKDHDQVDLLLRFGINPRSVARSFVLGSCDSALIERFLSAGLDPCAGNAMAEALKSTIPPLLSFVKRNRDRFPRLQHQIDLALLNFVRAADDRGVTIMLSLGANPHVPLETDNTCSRLEPYTAFSESIFGTHRATIRAKLMKGPIPPEQVRMLFRMAAVGGDAALIARLLAGGADPNDHEEGEPILRSFLWPLTSESKSGAELQSGLEALTIVLRAGAKMDFDEDGIAALRSSLLKAPSRVAHAVLQLFRQHGLLDETAVREITRTPAMKRLLDKPGLRRFR